MKFEKRSAFKNFSQLQNPNEENDSSYNKKYNFEEIFNPNQSLELDIEQIINPTEREVQLINEIKELKKKILEMKEIINELRNLVEDYDSQKGIFEKKFEELNQLKHQIKNEVDEDFDLGSFNEFPNDMESQKIILNDQHRSSIMVMGMGESTKRKSISTFKMNVKMDADYEIGIFRGNDEESFFGNIKMRIINFLDLVVPLGNDVRYLSSHYDKNIEGYFSFSRYLLTILIFICLLYSILIINQLSVYDFQSNSSFYCNYYIPCFFYYSRITRSIQNSYIYIYLVTTFIIFFGTLYKSMEINKKGVIQKLSDSSAFNYSKKFFNFWDWNARNSNDLEENLRKMKSLVTIGIFEEETRLKVKERTQSEKNSLIIRRIFSIFLSILILAASTCIIICGYALSGYLLLIYPGNAFFINFIPSVTISLTNIFIPTLLNKLVKFEKWDYNSTIVSQVMWRLYLSNLFNLIIAYFLNIYFTMFGLYITFNNKNFNFMMNLNNCRSQDSQNNFSSYFNCADDQAVINLLQNVMSDFIVGKFIDILLFLVKYMLNFGKEPYDVGENAAKTLIFVSQLLIIIPFFPYLAILSPLFLYLELKFEKFKLENLFEKPEHLSLKEDIIYFIMTLFSVSMMFVLSLLILFFNFQLPHGIYPNDTFMICSNSNSYYNFTQNVCGPFNKTEIPSVVFQTKVKSNFILNFLYSILSSPILIIFSIALLIILYFFKDDSKQFIKFIKEKEREHKNTLEEMGNQIRKLKTRLMNL